MPESLFTSNETFTQEEFWNWINERPSSDFNHYELLNGQIVMEPPAGWPHGGIGSALNVVIGSFVRKHKLGHVFDASTGFDLPSGDTVEPDVSYVSRQQMAAAPPPQRGRFLRVVPTLVVEILSRPTARRDRTVKKEIYERNGVREYWLVHPDRCEITIFALHGDKYDAGRTYAAGRLSSSVLVELEAAVADIFDF